MKFKVGDVVRVKNDLIAGKKYNNVYVSEDMARCKNKIYNIVDTSDSLSGLGTLYWLEGIEQFHFIQSMLETVEETKPKFKVGDKVKATGNEEHRNEDYEGVIDYISERPEAELKYRLSNRFYYAEEQLELIKPYLDLLKRIDKSKYKEESNMTEFEEIKNYNIKNLAEAKKQAEEQKANEEVVKAKRYYESLIDSKEYKERQIKELESELKEVKDKLKVFEAKKSNK